MLKGENDMNGVTKELRYLKMKFNTGNLEELKNLLSIKSYR